MASQSGRTRRWTRTAYHWLSGHPTWPPAVAGPVFTLLGLLISLVPVSALLWHRQLPNNPEVFRYLFLSELFSDAITSGAWYPRWIPDLNGGYG